MYNIYNDILQRGFCGDLTMSEVCTWTVLPVNAASGTCLWWFVVMEPFVMAPSVTCGDLPGRSLVCLPCGDLPGLHALTVAFSLTAHIPVKYFCDRSLTHRKGYLCAALPFFFVRLSLRKAELELCLSLPASERLVKRRDIRTLGLT